MTTEYNENVRQEYNEDQIQVLEGLNAVRKRPGMYIGDTYENGLHHLVWEIVDNSIDEHLAGRCEAITVFIHKDNSVSVEDNGAGIPVGMHKTGRPTLEVVLTQLHAGGKFGGEKSGYKTSGGLHGVGSSVVNALSSRMTAIVKRDGKLHRMEFEKGNVTKEIEVIGTCAPEETGTTIHFKPDGEIFGMFTEYQYNRIFKRMQESAFLNKGLLIRLVDERQINEETNEPVEATLLYERGIEQYVEFLNEGKELIYDDVLSFEGEKDGISVEVAFQYHNGGENDGVKSFVNNIKTPEGGTHQAGFESALLSTFKEYITLNKLLKPSQEIEKKDILVGLTAIVSAKIVEEKLQFEGQTKSKLGTKEARGIILSIVSERLMRFLEKNPDDAEILLSKIIQSYNIRMAAKKARELEKSKNSVLNGRKKPEKFKDCLVKDIHDPRREVYFVEGDSAGGSAKSARDKFVQAIMPLKGKIFNIEKAKIEKVLKNDEIKHIINIIGTGILDEFDYEKLQYQKVIIMTDADVDGEHIALLMLTFFYRYMRPLVEKGHIYMARPPLYKYEVGKKVDYYYSDEELDERVSEFPHEKATVQRYKGLGEMNPEQLWETTMDPEQRTLFQMSIDDAEEVEKVFVEFMGENAQPRREFLEKYGHQAEIDA